MVDYKCEDVTHPETDLKIEVYAPQWYKRGHHDDVYSQKVIDSKLTDESDYFKPYIEHLIQELLAEHKIKKADLIIIIPRSGGTFSPTLEKLGNFLASKFGGTFDKIIRKKPSDRKNISSSTFSERLKKSEEEFALIRRVGPDEKTIWILDDQKTTGSTLLVCTQLLKKSRDCEVYCFALSINRNVELFGE
ncbi:MAG: hypothetical protein ABSG05_02475 [Candidatus Pacearchaeota archaeon]|jgi:predicted amidophosphoribosyltransferase